MAAGKHCGYRDYEYWHNERETDFDFGMSKKGNGYRKRDYERRKGDYERVREYERGRLRARRREYREDFRQRNAKEREVMNGGYRSTCSRSDSGSSGDGGDGLRRFKVAVQAVDREPREPCKDGSDAKTKKAKFSPIVWDRDYREVSGSIKSRSFVDTTSCSPSPEEGEIYLEASPCNVDLRCDLPREDQLVENIGKGGVDQHDYVHSRSLMSSRWANDAGSPAGEITDTSADAKLGRKSSSELSEIRELSRSISPEVGEVKREGSEGDIYHDNDDGNNDSMEVDDSVIPSETESKEDDPGTPQRTQAPKKRANMLQGCRGVDEFERLNKIGEGTYGIVFRARDKKTGETVALKKVKMMNDGEGFPLTSLREINILLSFHHPSIVDLKEVVMGSDLDSIFMVMEYVEHDLKALMDTMKHPFSQSEVKCLMLQLLEGVKCLHDNWVLHRDLKTSNLLFNNRGELKICDFGLARKYWNALRPYTQMVVTLWYRAPELLLGAKEYSTAIDIWSVGCIMAELLSKEPLFNGKAELDQLDKIFRILGTPNETIWPGLSKLPGVKANFVKHKYNLLRRKFPAMSFTGPVLSDAGFDLLNKLLTYDPEKRITAEEALNHEWFREVPLPKSKEFMPTFPANHAKDRCMRRVMKRLGPLEEQRIKGLQQGESQTGTC